MKILFDIGGTKMRVALSDDGVSVSDPEIQKTPEDFNEAIDLIEELIKKVSKEVKINSISGGLAGVIKDGLVINSPNLPKWNGNNLIEALKERFSISEIKVANDADTACLGEAHFGAGKGHKIVAYFTISTGIGGGRVVDGKIGDYHFGFEPGWQIYRENSETFEKSTSGKALYEREGKKVKDLSKDKVQAMARDLALGIHNSIVHWSPDVVVLGGAVAIDVPEIVEMIEKEVSSMMKIFPETPPFKRTELENQAALWGALKL